VGHLTNVSQISDYFEKILQKNKKPWTQTWDAHSIDTSIHPFGDEDPKIYVFDDTTIGESCWEYKMKQNHKISMQHQNTQE